VTGLRYQPVDGRPYRLTLGLRPLDLADWIEVDQHREHDLALKRQLLAAHHDDVVAVLPDGLEPSQEVLALLIDHLQRRFPELTPLPDGSGLHPIEAAGRLVQEDLCVMRRQPAGAGASEWTLVAASVCFPSRWRLREKIGRNLGAIHAPVPGYAERIGAPTDASFDRLTPARSMWRLNWTLLADSELYQPGHRDQPPRPPPELTVRVERQTLRALPESAAVLFTIRTYRATLAELGAAHPETLTQLAATLRTVPAATQRYKDWDHRLPQLLDWLAAVTGST
jgi:dimethylamine monooxygenase subunit A